MAEPAWITAIFKAGQTSKDGIVRRHVASVDHYGGGVDNLIAAAKLRGFHVVQVGPQLVVLCNNGEVRVLA